ncbi:flagellar basal-body MS-ring/collar protein FliF [Verticiella sediminum]|nr:flagellar basal-body MS-ring/collar protein FliF [Verticiella sediminum]
MNAGSTLEPLLARLRAAPRFALIGIAALVVALLVALALWSRSPDYRVLFADLSERDGGAIVAALGQMNVPYRFADGSAAIMVPAERVHETRLALASQGLPRGGSVGFELLDQGKFGASQFTEQVNFQRALEGELARSIESINAVESARVHLALPRQSMFLRERQPPTASVMLQLYPGRTLDESQVAAIGHLVSASVPELSVSNISVVDQFGRLLSLPGSDGRGAGTAEFRRVRDIEQSYVQRIESILTPILGPGNARAQVTAEVDFSRREETVEVYRPNQEPGQAAIRSQQTSESVQYGNAMPQGIPGALTNQPPANPAAPITNPQQAPDGQDPAGAQPGTDNAAGNPAAAAAATQPAIPGDERREGTTNYELDRTITHLQHATGKVARLSVAVVVNHVPDAEGNPQPMPAERLDELRELVRQAMGYSDVRGDTLNLMQSAFLGPIEQPLPWWREPLYLDLAKTVGGWLLFLVIALWLWLGVARPAIRRQAASNEAKAAAAAAVETQQNDEVDDMIAAATKARQQSRYQENLETARELAMKDPRAVAAVLRSWMEK